MQVKEDRVPSMDYFHNQCLMLAKIDFKGIFYYEEFQIQN